MSLLAVLGCLTQPSALTQAPSEDGGLPTNSGGRIFLTYSPAIYASNGSHAASVSNGRSSNGTGGGSSHLAQGVALLQLTDVQVITPRGGISTLLIQGLTLQVREGGGAGRRHGVTCECPTTLRQGWISSGLDACLQG